MKTTKIPVTDSISELAAFWQSHDFTDFEDQLEEVPGRVFVRSTILKLKLTSDEADAIRAMAKAKGIPAEELVREWIVKQLVRRDDNGHAARRPAKRRSSRKNGKPKQRKS